MAVLFAVLVTVHGVVFIRQAEPLDRVAVEALRSFLVGQIQSGLLHPFEALRVGGRTVLLPRQAIESLLPVRQVHAEVTERYLVPVDTEQSQETVVLVEPRVLEIRFLHDNNTRPLFYYNNVTRTCDTKCYYYYITILYSQPHIMHVVC